MYGLEIKVENRYATFVYDLLKNINVQDYVWSIDADDVLINSEQHNEQGLFNEYYVDGKNFLNAIQTQDYYLIFADYKAFKSQEFVREIKDGVEMFESQCEIVFMCTDTTNIEIYCKEKNIYDTIISNCKNSGVVSFSVVEHEKIIERNMTAF